MICSACGKDCNEEEAIYVRIGIFEVNGKVFFFCSKDCLIGFCIYKL